MTIPLWFLFLTGAVALAYRGATLTTWTLAGAMALVLLQLAGGGFPWLAWVVFLAVAIPLNLRDLRQTLISRPALEWFRKVLPPMSSTEREAIEAGTVWWDRELASGQPDWTLLLATPPPVLTPEERAFLDGPTNELCAMLNDWDIVHERNDLPPEVWDFMKKNRFFGMIIPRRYGGLEFSPVAQSEIVSRICSRSVTAGVTVMVPNSLGPGELLMHYGTDEQKQHYLPRLARGEEVPCFALTSPYAGSDAGAMPDRGYACMGEHEGREVPGFRVTWEKRYITLGPVATVLGLAFKAYDPDGVLGDSADLGITCALIPTSTPGVEIGDRHRPGGAAFQNGPNSGRDVFVPMEWIIGGQAQVGKGWRMLMDCLSVGRAISLPALSVAASKLACRTTGNYARVRRQFRTPIGKFEGVEEALARIGAFTYRMDASRLLTASALNQGEKPSVLSAILKYHNTEGMRQVINDALDVHAGRGVCTGPSNYLSNIYQAVPVAITVEGANILTRSMIIFGQGAIRCHPYLLEEMLAAGEPDHAAALERFDSALFSHMGFTISNAVRATLGGLSGGLLAGAPPSGPARPLYRQITRWSSAFAFVSDLALLMLGGKLKRRESLSARFGDVLSHLYMASAVLKRFEDAHRPAADLLIVRWSVQHSLHVVGTQLAAILRNFPSRPLGFALRALVMPFGVPAAPGDELTHRVADLVLQPSPARDRLTDGIYLSNDPEDPVGRLEHAADNIIKAEPIERKLIRALSCNVDYALIEEAIAPGLEQGIIDAEEAEILRTAARAMRAAIDVDVFPGANTGQVPDQVAAVV